jgi:hypothetical protein
MVLDDFDRDRNEHVRNKSGKLLSFQGGHAPGSRFICDRR